MKTNNKKDIKRAGILLGVGLFTVVSGTLAYFTTSTSLPNSFKSALYQDKIVEEFTSPTAWAPGTTTSKTVKVTNTGNIPMAVRASYTESWKSANNTDLALKFDENNSAAIINFNEGWTKAADGYYYYGSKDALTSLAAGSTSSSFISGVTFNKDVPVSLTETKSDDGKTITYTSTGNGYDNATYTLTVTLETVQYDLASSIWK